MKGYTFIELLVVIAISAILFFVSYSSYQTFNKAQAIKNGVAEVKSTIRDAQNKAMSGEKVGESPCALSNSLVSWNFIWVANSSQYSVVGKFNVGSTVQPCGTKIYNLPATDNIKFTNGGTIVFNPAAHPVDLSLALNPICLKGDSNILYKITISKGGDINVFQKVANCP